MAPSSNDIRCRHTLLFTLEEAISVFTQRSYSMVAKNKALKTFLMRLAEEQPNSMRPLVRKMEKVVQSSEKDHENISSGKRSAEDTESSRKAKKARMQRTRSFVQRTFNCERVGENSSFFAQGEDEQFDRFDGAGDCKTTYTQYEIEFGLTHGTARIRSMFVTKFATIPHSEQNNGSRIFEICKQLKFEEVSASLVKFFRTPTKSAPIPLSCDVQDPSEILHILRKIDRFVQEPKTHKAFSQMRLFTLIDAMVQKGRHSGYQKVIDTLAKNDVGSEVSKDFTEKVNEYRTDYHRGRRLLEISQSFGGTGIVFIIVVIGSWKMSQGLTEFERSCLGIVASHLLSVRKIVECLGDSALEDYCRHGSLNEQKIKDLEELKGLVPDADDDISDQESEDDGE